MDASRLTKAKQALIADAVKAGYAVEHSEFNVDIVKRTKHAKPRVIRALRLWANGTAFDAKADLSIAKAIRNVNDMRAFLEI